MLAVDAAIMLVDMDVVVQMVRAYCGAGAWW